MNEIHSGYVWFLVGVGIAICLSCSTYVPETLSGDDDAAANMESDAIGQRSRCRSAWKELFEPWKSLHAVDFRSLTNAQSSIATDNDMGFSKLVRRVWQDTAEEWEEWGEWPVDDPLSKRVSESLARHSEEFVPKECASIIWLQDLIWYMLYYVDVDGEVAVEAPEEAPASLPLQSPYIQRWVTTWLLVRRT